MVKKALLFIINAVSIAIIILAILMLLTVVMTASSGAPNFLGYSVFRVLTGSMEPEIPVDSLIIVKRADPETVAVGDVISFYSNDPTLGGAVNTHRVTRIERENDELTFITKGDANNIEDRFPVSVRDLIGVVVFTSHALGVFVRLASNPLIFLPLIVVPLFVILITNLVRSVKLTKKLMAEQEEAERREALRAAAQKAEESEKNEGE